MDKIMILGGIAFLVVGGCDLAEGILYGALVPDIDILDVVVSVVNAIMYAI